MAIQEQGDPTGIREWRRATWKKSDEQKYKELNALVWGCTVVAAIIAIGFGTAGLAHENHSPHADLMGILAAGASAFVLLPLYVSIASEYTDDDSTY